MKNLFYWALCLLLFAACGKDSGVKNDDPQEKPDGQETTLEVSATDLVFEAEGGVQTFTVTCNGEWKLEGAGEWCTVDTDAGNGNRTVSVTAAAYDGLEDRNVNLTVKAGTQVKTVGVTQKHKDAIVLSKDKLDVPQDGGTLEVKIQSNIDYEVTIPDECSSWITLEPDTKAVTAKTFRFHIKPNKTPESRHGYIVFSGNDVKDTIHVYQAQQARLLLEKDTYDVAKKGETITVELKTNVDYNVVIPKDADWVSLVTTRALRTDRLTFTVAPNVTDNIRTAEIVFKDRNSNLSDTLHLTQGGKAEGDDRDITAEVDAEFAKILQEREYIHDATKILWKDVRYIDELWIGGCELTSLKGIEYFESLIILLCYDNQLTALDVSKNTELTKLDCGSNQLTSLDVSQNTELTKLDCGSNQLTSLDVSKNTKLTHLWFTRNQLTSLDVSKNTKLTKLWCSVNQLTALDVSKNTELTTLQCSSNQLTALDISQNTKLTELDCDRNQLTSLDVSQNTELITLKCDENQLTSLDVSKNIELTTLECQWNQLTSLDVSQNTKLTTLECQSNQLTSLDVKNTELITLKCDYNQLTSLDVSKNTELTTLECYLNQLTSLDVSQNTKLTTLDCHSNQLTSLDVSQNTKLTTLDCRYNRLTSLDVSKNTELTELVCWFNPGRKGVFWLIVWPGENDNIPLYKWEYNDQTVTMRRQKALTETVNGVSFEMLPVNGGTFKQGVGMGGGGFEMTVDNYYIGKYEVTQGLWKAVMGTTVEEQRDKAGEPEEELYGVGDNYPMYYVNWDEAQEFVKKLNTLTGRTYALPTEAQWEYAALGGEKANGYTYSGSNTIGDVAWYGGNSSMKSHPVGGKAANELGIYDMSGNVFEWCADGDAEERIVRGGSWSCNAESAKVVNRFGKSPDSRFANYGFRIVLLP